uniref:Uncharacterized protein n=1 Tax=Ulva partita TaxID=1605170 RepID=A0A1C9ZQM3_9CHLO|nr:hypothetical protein [Ulva partita]
MRVAPFAFNFLPIGFPYLHVHVSSVIRLAASRPLLLLLIVVPPRCPSPFKKVSNSSAGIQATLNHC